MKTLTSQVINGSLSNADKMMAREEFIKLRDFIDNISIQTRWNGVSMLAGGAGEAILARTAVSLFDASGNAISSTHSLGGTVVQNLGICTVENVGTSYNGFNGTVTASNGINATVTAVHGPTTMVPATTASAALWDTLNFSGTILKSGNIHLADFMPGSAQSNGSQVSFTIGTEVYINTTTPVDCMTSSAPTIFTSTTNAGRTLTFYNLPDDSGGNIIKVHADSILPDVASTPPTEFVTASDNLPGVTLANSFWPEANTPSGFSTALNILFGGLNTDSPAADVSYDANQFSITLSDGSIYSNATAFTPGVNGILTLTNTTDSTKTISVVLDSNITGLTTSFTDAAAAFATTFTTDTVFVSTSSETITSSVAFAPLNNSNLTGTINGKVSTTTVNSYTNGVINANEVVVTMENGEIFKNQGIIQVSSGGTFTLTSTSNSQNTMTITFAGNTSGITSAQTFATNLQTLLTKNNISFGGTAVQNVGITANGLAADSTYGFTSSVSSSTGFISGIATKALVKANGSQFDVSITVGNQVYTNTVSLPSNNGTLELMSTTDGENKLVFQYGSQTASAVTDGVTFHTTLLNFLGLQNGTAPAQFKPDSGATGGTTGIDGILSGGSASPGKYALSYKPEGSGLSGIFKLSDGINTYEKYVSNGGKQVVLFSNAVSALLGDSFQLNTPLSQRIFDISSGGGLAIDFQVAELSTDVLTIKLPAVTLSALNMVNADINTQAAAQEASALIDQAMNAVNKSYANLGAQQKQLEVNKDILSSNIINMQSAIAEFIDADIPEAMTRMTSSSVQYQMASAMLVQANERTKQLLTMTK